MKWPWPDTLVGRTVLVMIAGLILSQVAGVVIFSANRFQLESRLFGSHVSDRIAAAVKLTESTPAADRVQLLRALDVPGLHVGWGAKPLVEESDTAAETAEVLASLGRRLGGYTINASMGRPPDITPGPTPPPPSSSAA